MQCGHSEHVAEYVVRALGADDAAAFEAHLATCATCRAELEAMRPVVDALAVWPTDVLRPTAPLQQQLARRIADETGTEPVVPPPSGWKDPEWCDVAPGISCKFLAADPRNHRMTMLVRLIPGASYPAHTHAGVEELHLLDGELWIDDRLLHPGDYNLGHPGGRDKRVYSETGCTCVLITSTDDVLE
jgi:anti-sigma factor RsiW